MSRANKTINRHYINIANCKNRIKTIGIGLKEIEWNKNYEQKNSTIKNRERQTNQSR